MRGVDMKAYITRFQKSHLLAFCLFALMSLALLTACGSEKATQPYDVTYNGKTYTVDQVQQTITVDGEVCHYEIERQRQHCELPCYIDGPIYWWQEDQYGGMGGWNYGYDPRAICFWRDVVEVLELDHKRREKCFRQICRPRASSNFAGGCQCGRSPGDVVFELRLAIQECRAL